MTAPAWTAAHQRHALAWLLRRAWEAAERGDVAAATRCAIDATPGTESPPWHERHDFAAHLYATIDGIPRDVERVLARVDALAEGRVVVTTTREVTGQWASADGRSGRVVTTRRRVRRVEAR